MTPKFNGARPFRKSLNIMTRVEIGEMSEQKNKIKLFDDKQVRFEWDWQAEKWWFSVWMLSKFRPAGRRTMARCRTPKKRLTKNKEI
ncbi:MAG: hypothetical protein LBU43_08015 [Candidatus Accumulibacter sp.]|jgi:hypothetical protein|nr:hypothetical protein [Accumulibacter sp.]